MIQLSHQTSICALELNSQRYDDLEFGSHVLLEINYDVSKSPNTDINRFRSISKHAPRYND